MNEKDKDEKMEDMESPGSDVENSDTDYWAEFQLGVRSVFKKWTAMRMAVDHGWGGRNSAEKEEILIQSVIDLLDAKPDVDRLITLIEEYLPDNFSMILEDDSAELVALDIWDIYCDCGEGDTTKARKLFDTLPLEQQREITNTVGLTKPEIIEAPNVPQEEHIKMVDEEEEDDEGWEVVVRKHKK